VAIGLSVRRQSAYWMTVVAWTRTDGGMVNPIAWAVFKLTTKPGRAEDAPGDRARAWPTSRRQYMPPITESE